MICFTKNILIRHHFPNLVNFKDDYCDYPLEFGRASFQDVCHLYNSERASLAKLAPHLTMKACFPSSIEHHNVKLVLKVFNELTVFALTIQYELRQPEYRNSTAEFVDIFFTLTRHLKEYVFER